MSAAGDYHAAQEQAEALRELEIWHAGCVLSRAAKEGNPLAKEIINELKEEHETH